jgi:hypothetical protein
MIYDVNLYSETLLYDNDNLIKCKLYEHLLGHFKHVSQQENHDGSDT